MIKIGILLLLATICPPCLQTPLPSGEKTSSNVLPDAEVNDDVMELESLRIPVTNKVNNTETNHLDNFPLRETSEPLPTPLSQNEAPQPNSRSAIFRHRGITEAKKNYWAEKMPQDEDLGEILTPEQNLNSLRSEFAGIQYSPTDLAIYVFNTGDEEGVAVAVEELVREGMMGRTDAINYLQDVKQILSFLRDQCNHQKPIDDFKNRAYPKPELTQRFPNPPREQFISAMDLKKRDPKTDQAISMVTTEHPHETVIASTSEPKAPAYSASTTTRPKSAIPAAESYKEDQQENELDDLSYKAGNEDMKRKGPTKTSDAFALQVVYKLAMEMFSKSLMRDDPTAEDTLSGLINFLETEVGNNIISPDMKEEVLEVVSAALVDSLRDYQKFIQANQVSVFDESDLYQQQSKMGKAASKVPISDIYRKLAMAGHENMLQLASKNNRPNSS